MNILVADDNPIALDLVEHTLVRSGYQVVTANDGHAALDILREGSCQMVITDWEMPGMTGLELCRHVRASSFMNYVYVILLTARGAACDAIEGMSAGADDFIAKPFQPAELTLRVRAGERLLSLETRDLLIFALARLAESRDSDTGAHLERVRTYSRIIAEHLATQPKYRDTINADFVRLIYLTSPLHDIGKVATPDSVLLKPGPLTRDEFEIMKTHTTHGAATLEAALQEYPSAHYLRMARDIAASHHEWYDGTGYPLGLSGEAIPLCGRIVALADVYDALTSRRIYKEAYSHQRARDIVLAARGSHFDPDVVDAFVANEAKFQSIGQTLTDPRPERPSVPLALPVEVGPSSLANGAAR
jgi:putative two-component system response regulator